MLPDPTIVVHYGKKGKTVGRVTPRQTVRLVKEKVVEGGMLVKVKAARKAVNRGVKRARVSMPGRKKGTTIRRRGRR